jgi:hypothetical protein
MCLVPTWDLKDDQNVHQGKKRNPGDRQHDEEFAPENQLVFLYNDSNTSEEVAGEEVVHNRGVAL